MKFITEKTTETGKKFTALLEKADIAVKERSAFMTKYGFSKYRATFAAWGGLSSCKGFEKTPDPKAWGKGSGPGEKFPKLNSNKGKAIYAEIQNLTIVSWDELNACVGWVDPGMGHIGFSQGHESEFYGFSVRESDTFVAPEDCKEITTTEFNRIFKPA